MCCTGRDWRPHERRANVMWQGSSVFDQLETGWRTRGAGGQALMAHRNSTGLDRFSGSVVPLRRRPVAIFKKQPLSTPPRAVQSASVDCDGPEVWRSSFDGCFTHCCPTQAVNKASGRMYRDVRLRERAVYRFSYMYP